VRIVRKSEKDGSPPRELIKVSGSIPLSLASERKSFKPSWASRSRAWMPLESKSPRFVASFPERRRYRIAGAAPGGFGLDESSDVVWDPVHWAFRRVLPCLKPCSGVSSVGTGNEAGASLTRSRIWQEPKSRLNG
jgi:hypothetical protein